jgi:hypothetical protein
LDSGFYPSSSTTNQGVEGIMLTSVVGTIVSDESEGGGGGGGGAPSATLGDEAEDDFAQIGSGGANIITQQFDFGGAYQFDVKFINK